MKLPQIRGHPDTQAVLIGLKFQFGTVTAGWRLHTPLSVRPLPQAFFNDRAAHQKAYKMHSYPGNYLPESKPSAVNSQAAFLSTMDQVLPWTQLRGLARPGQTDCPPARLERMLRIYLVQEWFGLSDQAAETALHDSLSIRAFAGVDQGNIFMPSAREIREFRECMDSGAAGRTVKAKVDRYLLANRYFLRSGSRIDPVLGRYDQQTGYLRPLADYFERMSRPYELREILQFNAIYRDLFEQLNAAERQRAEQFVEHLIDGAASPDYVPRIFGVV